VGGDGEAKLGPGAFPPVFTDDVNSAIVRFIGKDRLNDQQKSELEKLLTAPTTVKAEPFQTSTNVRSSFAKRNPLDFEDRLGGANFLVADYRSRSVTELPEWKGAIEFFDWEGKDPSETMSVTASNEGMQGVIRRGPRLFSIEPLGGEMCALVELDLSKSPGEHTAPPHAAEENNGPNKNVAPATAANPVDITVLVAYTPKVAKRVAFMNRIVGAVEETTKSFRKSGVHVTLALAGTYPFNYVESGNQKTDLDAFRNDAGVKAKRQACRANMCVLLADDPSVVGLSAAVMATKDTAFSLVNYNYAVTEYTFLHEIGHLMGAEHNPEDTPDKPDPSHPWSHGYRSQTSWWRTIMSYGNPKDSGRIPYWSNPDISYPSPGDEKLGTPQAHNNARMLNATARIIASYR